MAKKMMLSSRIDEQVLFTFLGVGLLSLIVFGFRYISHPNCAPVGIQVNGNIVEGKATTFRAETVKGTAFVWNFGDGQTAAEETPSTRHTYKHPGKYVISVLVNGSCDESIAIFVNPGMADSVAGPEARIEVSKDTVSLNEEIMFSDASINSTSWIWNLGEPGVPEQYSRNVKIAYTTSGHKRIILTVNGKAMDTRYIYVREKELPKITETKEFRPVAKKVDLGLKDNPVISPIVVPVDKPKPEPEPVVVSKTPDLPDKGYLVRVFQEGMEGGDWKEALSKYICAGEVNMQVIYNGSPTTLSKVLSGLSKIGKKEAKKISKFEVVPALSKQTNCITTMTITVQKVTGVWPLKKTTNVDIN